MLLSISLHPSLRKTYPKRIIHLKCDECGLEFTRQNTLDEFKQYHTCSKSCKYKRQSRLTTKHQLVERTCLICKVPFWVKENRQKQLCSVKCQVQAQQKGEILDQKKRKVFLEHFGVDHPQRATSIKEKTKRTNLERYGVEYLSQSPIIQDRVKKTNNERFGVDWHTQSSNFATKAKETWIENYGVDHPMKSDEVKAKYDFNDIWKQAHETKKQNGTYANSKDEDEFHKRLVRCFGEIQRNVRIEHENGSWWVDFYVNNKYVQFDGIYWHGLDRPLQIIRESHNVRDIAIVKAYERDRLQDEWFPKRNLSLIRITDKEAEQMSDDELKRQLK